MIRKLFQRRWRVSEVTLRLPLVDVSLRPQEPGGPKDGSTPAVTAEALADTVLPAAASHAPRVRESDPLSDTSLDSAPTMPTRPAPLAAEAFERLRAAMAAEAYSPDQITVFKSAPPETHFTVAQICSLVDVIHYADEKLELVRLARRRLVDPENAYVFSQHFPYFEDKAKVSAIISENASDAGKARFSGLLGFASDKQNRAR
jgi:hypothetical protein